MEEKSINILLVGDSGVGKTCIISRFADEHYNGTHIPTIGVDFKVKSIKLLNATYKLAIWDTAGLERFHSLTQSWYRRAEAFLIVYDITDTQSFDNLTKWLHTIEQNCRDDVIRVVVGNKRDRLLDRRVTELCGKQFALDNACSYYETSAKENVNVAKVFHDVAQDVVENRQVRFYDAQSKVTTPSTIKLEHFRLMDDEYEAELSATTSELLNEQMNLNCALQQHKEYMHNHDLYLRQHDMRVAAHRKRIQQLQNEVQHKIRELHDAVLSI